MKSPNKMSMVGKCIVALALGVLVSMGSTVAMASVPEVITHQGRLTDEEGEPETGEVTLGFQIYDDATGGDVLWEAQETVDLGDSGFYSVELGGESNPLGAEVLQGGMRYMGVSVDGGEELEPRIALNSVPYAAVAGSVEGMDSMRGISVLDAVDTGGGVLGEADEVDDAYRGQAWRVTSSDGGADGETPVWSLDAASLGREFSTNTAAVSVRLKVANNSLSDRLVTFRCVAERGGEDVELDQLHIAPDDFSDSYFWEEFLIHCEFGPDDDEQRILVDAYEPDLTTLAVDYVRSKPLSDLPFILSWMMLENQVTERELAPDSVAQEHLMSDSVTSDAIASNAVGPDELDDAIEVYNAPEGCGKSGLMLSSSCNTIQCGSTCGFNSNESCYYDCDGGCFTGMGGNTSPQSCSTDFVGYLMGSDAGN